MNPSSSEAAPEFRIYRASAGSGKTYALTKEYLKLALRPDAEGGEGYFRHVLAVTFTNKATEEMKGRIVRKLADLRDGETSPLSEELREATGLSADDLRRRAAAVLTLILHQYPRFAVSTIDSFFQRVLRAFAYETELNVNYRVELDEAAVLEDLAVRLLADVGQDEQLTRWLLDYAQARLRDGKGWDFRRDVLSLSREIFKEPYRQLTREHQRLIDQPGFVTEFVERVGAIRAAFETALQAVAERADSLLRQHGLTATDFSHGNRGVVGYLLKLSARSCEPGKRARQAFETGEGWVSKSNKKTGEAAQRAVEAGLADLLAEAIDRYDTDYRTYATATAVLKQVYTFGILTRMERHLKAYRDEHDVLPISDVAPFLSEIIGGHDAPYLYEKTGGTYRHFLIDEFQDTASLQWRNFLPLVRNGLGEGHLSLVVGDSKQAIYRWRGGDWRLLLYQLEADISKSYQRVFALQDNWRSLPQVVAFNNALFAYAPAALAAHLREQIDSPALPPEVADLLRDSTDLLPVAYQDGTQAVPTGRSEGVPSGYVEAQFYPAKADTPDGTGRSWKEEVHERLPRLIEQLQDEGYSLSDVAVLTRTRREGSAVAHQILHYAAAHARPGYRYDVVSNESLLLGAATSVRVLISALAYLQDPADRLAAATLVNDYHRYGRDAPASPDLYALPEAPDACEEALRALLPAAFSDRRAALSKLPLYELVENLVQCFGLDNQPAERAYLQNFQDTVLTFGQEEQSDVAAFLTWWEARGKETAVQMPEAQEAIRIMTVHKAKGLEFMVVIVPYADWKFENVGKDGAVVWGRTTEAPFGQVPVFPLRYEKELGKSAYALDYYQEHISTYLDQLNTLYVALTRAEERLYLMAPEPTKSDTALKNVATLLYRGVREMPGGIWDEATQTFRLGEPTPPAGGEAPAAATALAPDPYPVAPWRERFAIRSRADEFFDRAAPDPARLRRQLLMELPAADHLDATLERYYFEGQLTRSAVARWRQELSALLSAAPLRDWFAPGQRSRTDAALTSGGRAARYHRLIFATDGPTVVQFAADAADAEQQRQLLRRAAPDLRAVGAVAAFVYDVSAARAERVV